MGTSPLWMSKLVDWTHIVGLASFWRLVLIPALAVLLLWLSLWAFSPQPIASQPDISTGASDFPAISGLVQARMGVTQFTYLTAFTVTLQQTPTLQGTPPLLTTHTDEYARFVFPSLPQSGTVAGEYAVCWEAEGWIGDCLTATAEPMIAVVKPFTGTKMIWGRATFADGTSPWFVSPHFGVKQTVEVLLSNAPLTDCPVLTATNLLTIPTTVWGDYVFVDPPFGPNYLTARYGDLGGGSTLTEAQGRNECSRSLEVSGTGPAFSVYRPITYTNRRPIDVSILIFQNGIENNEEGYIWTPDYHLTTKITLTEGISLDLELSQKYDDPLRQGLIHLQPENLRTLPKWYIPSNQGVLTTNSFDSQVWVLPNRVGWYRIRLLEVDASGGYIEDSALVEVITSTRQARMEPPLPASGINYLSKKYPSSATPSERTVADGNGRWSTEYYHIVDPEYRRLTLGNWWAVNGFDPESGDGGVRAAYLNLNDLGFGRNMNCLQRGQQVACYVTNYGDVFQDQLAADMAYLGERNQAVATVAMEYSLIEGGLRVDPQHLDMDASALMSPVVKFFVFRGGEANGQRLLEANLVGLDEVQKTVPYVCLHCHGGNYNHNSLTDAYNFTGTLGAYFLPFDLKGMRFSEECIDQGDALCSAETIRRLNDIVRASSPDKRTLDLLDGWYPFSNTVVQEPWRPAGWYTDVAKNLYDNVIGPSCRNCHLHIERGPLANSLFNPYDADVLSKTFSVAVLRSEASMPHSYIQNYNLWCGSPPLGTIPFSRPITVPIDILLTTLSLTTTRECK